MSFFGFLAKWQVAMLVLLSLLMQSVLVLVAGKRRKMTSQVIAGTLWLAYLLTDYVATYSLGVISKSQYSGSPTRPFGAQLMALWASFLILHLGGPDTITAFSLEDNQLWLRHGFGLVAQVSSATYVQVKYKPKGWLLASCILVLLSGAFKYGERTWALKSASMDGLRKSMLGKPDPGPDYANKMSQYTANLRAGIPARILGQKSQQQATKEQQHQSATPQDQPQQQQHQSATPQAQRQQQQHQIATPKDQQHPQQSSTPQDQQQLQQQQSSTSQDQQHQQSVSSPDQNVDIRTAYELFRKFKGLFVDSILTFKDREQSLSFFLHAKAEAAFKMVELELSFAYDMLYSKAKVSATNLGRFIRFTCLGLTASASFLFYKSMANPRWNPKPFLNQLDNEDRIKVFITCALFAGALLIDIFSLIKLWFSDWSLVNDSNPCGCRKWILRRRRWSNKIAQYNLLSFCLKDRQRSPCVSKSLELVDLKTKRDSYFNTKHVKVTSDHQNFILEEVKRRYRVVVAESPRNYNRFNGYRGQWALEQERLLPLLEWTVVESEFDESLLIWHIATDLCYRMLPEPITTAAATDKEAKRDREMAQELSNYLMYLLVVRPLMLSSTSVVGVKKFEDTCAEIVKFLIREPKKDLDVLEACKLLLIVNTDCRSIRIKGDQSKSVLWDGCRLAKLLKSLDGAKRWRVVCKVMFEMLFYTAINCRGYYHAEQLSRGGELLTFIWFLVSHFGMGKQYMVEAGERDTHVVGDERTEQN